MVYIKKRPVFTPVVMFTPSTDADHLAVKQIHSLQADIRETMDTDRSRQTTIGLSEIGTDCIRCLCRKLSDIYTKIVDPSWKAQVGTFIHAGLEEHFENKYGRWETVTMPDGVKASAERADWDADATDKRPRYHMERRVTIHTYKWLTLGGSCDLFIEGATFGLVDDWKTQGAPKLKKTANGDIGNTYPTQMMAYGLGYTLLGHTVTHVVLYALPRDGELDEAKPVLMRYDPQIVINRLAKIVSLIDSAEALEMAFPGEGWERLIRVQDRAGQCFDCDGYDSQEQASFLTNLVSN